jgi:hypothetical protein
VFSSAVAAPTWRKLLSPALWAATHPVKINPMNKATTTCFNIIPSPVVKLFRIDFRFFDNRGQLILSFSINNSYFDIKTISIYVNFIPNFVFSSSPFIKHLYFEPFPKAEILGKPPLV